jgi:hypothetical protein
MLAVLASVRAARTGFHFDARQATSGGVTSDADGR